MSPPMPVWTARTGTPPAADLAAYGACVDADHALLYADLAGSIAHIVGLHAAELVTADEATELIEGLQAIAQDAADGTVELDPALEDVHMNLEHQLAQTIGPLAEKLHTARSRNDQVALDLVLVTRQGLVELAGAAHALASTLAEQAHAHASTPRPVHTHGLPAQPATLGYLLHAHALRFARDARALLDAFDGLDESPLGSGAGATTTLPIDPSVPADLLGLAPPANGLLATGARDGTLEALDLAARTGQHAQALAVDLLDLAGNELVQLPSTYTTGSSIMPHKANPDALELARADGGTLTALRENAYAVTSKLGLGYQRDLQRAKPPLLEALALAPEVLTVLANVVDGVTVDQDALAQLQATPGVATTDAAEALVAHGVPFRTAHQHLSEACHAAEQEDTTIADALAEADLPGEAIQAAIDALVADPADRSVPGGPAPETVHAALDDLASELDALHEALQAAGEHAQRPFALLETDPSDLLADPQTVIA